MRTGLNSPVLWFAFLLSVHAQSTLPPLLDNAYTQNPAFTGVGRWQGPATCTAFFIWTVSDPTSPAPAHVLTNGHCFRTTGATPNAVAVNEDPARASVTFHYFHDTQNIQYRVAVRRIAYSTMKGIDLTVAELDTTIGDLTSRGIWPLELAASEPHAGDALHVVGAPRDGVPADQAFLRRSDCVHDGQANLLEFGWHFFDAQRNSCAGIRGGSSGSPVIATATGQAVAILNTTTADSLPGLDCYLNAPCEVSVAGQKSAVNRNYASTVAGLTACFSAEGRFDAARAACPLDSGRQLTPRGYPLPAVRPVVSWNSALTGPFTHYRYKSGRGGAVDCRDASGYGTVAELAGKPRIEDPIGTAEGRQVLCIQAGNSATVDASWQKLAFVTQVHVWIDTTPPVYPPTLFVDRVDERFRITWQFVPPELSLYQLKSGPAGETSCDDPEGYFIPRIGWVDLPVSGAPYTVCAIGYDQAGNATPPRPYRVE